MSKPTASPGSEETASGPMSAGRAISEAARRALAEAEARRQARPAATPLPPEQGGRVGPEPVRYGDWEKNGIASDF